MKIISKTKIIRTQAEIDEQIAKLKEIKSSPKFRSRTAFGDSNLDAIDAHIDVLEHRLSSEECFDRMENEDVEWSEHVAECASDAADWLTGDLEDSPERQWEGLY